MEISNVLNKLGVERLSKMQESAERAMLQDDKDIVVLSPTGTGKTLAYLLPLLQLVDAGNDNVQAVVIVPGRELALQSADVMKNACSGLRCCSCYGGRMAMDEHRMLRQQAPHVVFATPGRLNDHLDKGNICAEQIRYVVIDEFDKCLEMGFAGEMEEIMRKLTHVKSRMLLSATDAESIPRFVNMGHTIRLDYLADGKSVPDRVDMYKVRSIEKDKLKILSHTLRTFGSGSSIVFVNYRESVERVAAYLRDEGFSVSAYHGGLEQREREAALYMFANGSNNILVSTDLASRGLDIPFVENIVHYHLPENEDGYVHRVGRTARWDAGGRVFFILGPMEELPQYVNVEVIDYQLPDNLPPVSFPLKATIYIGKGKQSKISKSDIVGFLCKKAGLKSSEIGRIDVKDRYSYVAVDAQKVSQVLRMANGEKIKGVKTIIELVHQAL